ncbi:InlB B-repeat-containing protein [Culicoidibacter larvae]|uniref:InlB B-repeat-containing protein n=1 Tax=Culicoidibacter larvae TaxID=2579976 RepID=UPI003BAF6773
MSFNTKGGTGVASITAKTDTTVDLDTVTTTRPGYQFDGWFVGSTEYTGVVTVPAGGLALEAHWTALDQTITFDVNGGNIATQPADIIQVTDSTVDLDAVTAPTWFGHKFLGWKDATDTGYSGTITMPAGGLTLIADWQDLIADGVWQIDANNISMSIDEFRDLVNQGTLEQEVLSRSNARAWNDESGEAVDQVYLQWDSFSQITTAGTYIANVYVDEPVAASTASSTVTTYNENVVTLNTNIQIELYANPKEADSLPATGMNSFEMLLAGLVLVGLGLGVYRKLNKR